MNEFNNTSKSNWNKVGEWDSKSELIIAFSQYPQTKQGFEEYLDDRSEMYPEIEYYRNNGSWRDTSPVDDDTIEEALGHIPNQEPNNCYYNVQTSLSPDVSYVEGYALSGKGVPAPHSWLEVDGSVVDITPPIKNVETHYWGVEFDNVTVVEAMLKREVADPIVEWVIEECKRQPVENK